MEFGGVEVTGCAERAISGPIQGHKLFNKFASARRRSQSPIITTASSEATGAFSRPVDISWLAAASKTYNISSDPSDFVLVEVPAVTSDIPNKNLQCFSSSELFYFDPMRGRQVYKTFQGAGCHFEHQNKEPLKAKGVIFDVVIVPVPRYGVNKVILLTGWDRTKDRDLTRDIESGERDGYSMGSIVNQFICSVTGQSVDQAGGRYKRGQRVSFGDGRPEHLCFHYCTSSFFFEISSVGTPADQTAIGYKKGVFNISKTL